MTFLISTIAFTLLAELGSFSWLINSSCPSSRLLISYVLRDSSRIWLCTMFSLYLASSSSLSVPIALEKVTSLSLSFACDDSCLASETSLVKSYGFCPSRRFRIASPNSPYSSLNKLSACFLTAGFWFFNPALVWTRYSLKRRESA
jgi:hypothetical protein